MPPRRKLPSGWVHRDPQRMWAEGERRQGASWLSTLLSLSLNEFRVRYRDRALGVIWSFIQPLVMMAVLTVALSAAFKVKGDEYPISLLTGLLVWNFFSSAVSGSVGSLVANAETLKRTMVPREVIPLSTVISYVANLAIEGLALVALIPFFLSAFHAPSPALLLIPVAVVALVLLVSGIALLASALHVVYRDIGYIVATALNFLYWLTPIVYPLDIVPRPYRTLLVLNPLTSIVQTIRNVVLWGAYPTELMWIGMFAPSLVSLGLGWFIFRRYERVVLDHV